MNTTHAPTNRSLGGPFRGFGTIFWWGVRRSLRGKKAWITLAATIGIGALIGAASGQHESDPLVNLWHAMDAVLLRVVAPVIALLTVAQGFAAELRGGTLLYHLVRPVPRHVVFIGRFVSGLVAGALACAALTLGTAITASRSVPLSLWLQFYVVLLFMVTAAGAFYYTLAALIRRGLIVGLVYTFLIEVLLGTMPGGIQKAAINHHARALFHGWCDAWFMGRSSLVTAEAAKASAPEPGSFSPVGYGTPGTAIAVLLCIALGCLLYGVWRIRQRDFALKD